LYVGARIRTARWVASVPPPAAHVFVCARFRTTSLSSVAAVMPVLAAPVSVSAAGTPLDCAACVSVVPAPRKSATCAPVAVTATCSAAGL
jgi:hypothetical protein